MRLKKITITNMMAFESFETELPAVAIVQGENGAGKTSLLNCVRYAFGRDVENKLVGHDADMIHGNAPSGEILIEFDDGGALRCRASRETNETTRSYRKPGTTRFEVSRKEIDAIASAVSYDALSFMRLGDKEQLSLLLKIMPVEISREEIGKALQGTGGEVSVSAEGMNGFDAINAWYNALYARRREYNTAADTQAKHAAELERALPPAAPEGQDWKAEAERLQTQKQLIESAEEEQIATVRQILEEEKQAAQNEYMGAVEAAARYRDERIEAARAHANETVRSVKAANAPKLDALTADLATAQERSRTMSMAEGTRKAAESARQQATAKQEQAARITKALGNLQALRESLAKRLPIPGVVIEDGRICRMQEGKLVPFSRWNTVAQMTFCLRIAVMSHGEAGFILCDKAEHFNAANRKALLETAQKYAEKEGLQIVLATVSDTPLTVSAPKGP